jgi:hypothetical protein
MLMAQHPDIATIGELKATAMGDPESYVCSCGSKLLDCRFWTGLISKMKARGMELDLNDFETHFTGKKRYISKILLAQIRSPFFEYLRKIVIRFLPELKREYNKILEKNKNMVEIICDLQEKECFLDGSKDPQRLLYFISSNNWDIKVIKMIRDGRAQSNSCRRKKGNPLNFIESVREWKKTVLQIEKVCAYSKIDNVYSLKYEDLCESPDKYMNEIWDFIGLNHIRKNWSEIDIQESEHHILGNNMRTKSKIFISLDEGWKTSVTEEELSAFEDIAGNLNRLLGYKS